MIITISREFGSGGREVGKRLADELGIKYYDKEIISEIAKQSNLNEKYVEEVLSNGSYSHDFYYSFGQTFSAFPMIANNAALNVFIEQRNVIKRLAEQDCIIVGRSADVILKDKTPFRIFVYADDSSKLQRTKTRLRPGEEKLTDKQLLKKMSRIDKARKKIHSMISDIPWGDRQGYDLMINTSNINIKEKVPIIAEYIRRFYIEQK